MSRQGQRVMLAGRTRRTQETVATRDIREVLEGIAFTPDDFQIDVVMRSLEQPVLGVSIPRQNGKTEIGLMSAFIGGLRGDAVAVLAHNGSLSREQARRAAAIAEPLIALGLVSGITRTMNLNRIDFTSGGFIVFQIRSSVGVLVGLTLDRIVVDEAQKMTAAEYEGLAATTTTSPRRSILMIGTPPTDEDLAKVGTGPFVRARERGGRGWMEFGVGDYKTSHPAWRVADFHAANPAWRRIPHFMDLIRSEKASMDDERFARQRMGAWVLPEVVVVQPPELSPSEVSSLLSARGPSQDAYLHAGLGLYLDSPSAVLSFSDGESYEVIESIPCVDGDLSLVLKRLKELARRFNQVVLPMNSLGKALARMMTDNGMGKKLRLSTMPDTATSIAQWYRDAHAGQLSVFNNRLAAEALSSAWRGYSAHAQAGTVEAGDPEVRATMLSLVLAYGPRLRRR